MGGGLSTDAGVREASDRLSSSPPTVAGRGAGRPRSQIPECLPQSWQESSGGVFKKAKREEDGPAVCGHGQKALGGWGHWQQGLGLLARNGPKDPGQAGGGEGVNEVGYWGEALQKSFFTYCLGSSVLCDQVKSAPAREVGRGVATSSARNL